MQTVSTFEQLDKLLGGNRSSLTIGVFDGVHIGHQALIAETLEAARLNNDVTVAVTFGNHPLSVLAPPYTPRSLVTTPRKADLLGSLGIQIVLMLDFTQIFATTPAEAFVNDFLVRHGAIRTIVCGYDFTFGSLGAGNSEMLRNLGMKHDFEVKCVQAVDHENHVVKSTHVRDLLTNGSVAEAGKLLTRPHEVPGIVISGMARGRTIGFPTANLKTPETYQLPGKGVYACAARVGVQREPLPAMVNLGTSPTFGDNAQTIEAHILNFEGEIHGQQLSLYFLERLRDEQRFPDVSGLIEQLKTDRAQTGQLWDSPDVRKFAALIPGPVDHRLKLTATETGD